MRALYIFLIWSLFFNVACSSYQTIAVQPSQNHENDLAYCQIPTKSVPRKQVPLLTKTIIIDPGHGGRDQGTHASGAVRYEEKELNLSTALLLERILKKLGYQVHMTRNQDQSVELLDRASFANEKKADLFVSVHYNSAPNKQANGIEVYFYESREKPKRSRSSEQLGQYVLNGIIEKTNANPRGVRKGNFAVIRETSMPAILVEGGFLTNQPERENILDPAYQKKIAIGIAQGIEHYFAAQKLAKLDP